MNGKPILRRIGRTLARPAVYLTLLVLLLALLVWFAGPLAGYGDVRPLAPVSVRLALLLLLALLWGIGGVLMRTRRSSEEQALLAGLRRQQEEKDDATDREAAAIERRFQDFRITSRAARKVLSRSRGAGLRGSTLPWYVVLGSAASGKTTLSRNLRATIGDDEAQEEAAPAARFHISDEAVLVEFDGAFVAQQEPWARRLWPRMLDQLRGQRSRQPLNGIMLALSVDELLGKSPEDLADLATSLRRRVDEIGARLRTSTPVYVVVTKLDLLLGFEDFFENLPAEEREATFGFPLAATGGQPARPAAEAFADGFAALAETLSRQVMTRLYEEPDELRRRRINELPAQFALLRQRLAPLVQHLGAASRFSAAPLLRGVFFVSALQTSDFIDPAAPALGADFGHGPTGLAALRQSFSPRSRPFFMQGLMNEVMLREKGLAGLTRPGRLIMQTRDIGANIALALAAVFLVVLWWLAFTEGRAYVARLDGGVSQARQSLARAVPDGVPASDFVNVLDALNDMRALTLEQPRRTTAALYETGNADEAAQEVYDRALSAMALPFVWRYLRDGLDAPDTPAALRMQQLKLYLMIGGERPVDPATARMVAGDFTARWLPNDRSAAAEEAVGAHLAEFARLEVTAPPVDLALVDRARGHISDYTLARVAYDIALAMPDVARLPAWRPVDHMGLAGPQALSRVSGKSFWDGIRGVYTGEGLSQSMLPASRAAASLVAEDLWVMDMAGGATGREAQRIRDGVLDLYRVDYITAWESLLSDLDIAQVDDAGALARAMALIVGQPSPVTELAAAIAAETDLAADGASPLDPVPGTPARLQQAQRRLQQAQGAVLGPTRIVDVAGAVSEHFREYRAAVIAAEGQQAQLTALLGAMEPLYRQINHVATGGDVLELGTDPQTLLAALTERVDALPQSLQALFRRILNKAAAVTSGSSRERLAQIWASTVLPLCVATTDGRYPFNPGSRNDASLADFASLFGPKGAIASFRNDYLRPFIDTNAKPWRWRTGQQFGLDLDDGVLRQFELADEITTAYFGEAEAPQVAFTVEPVSLDTRARAFQFDIGGPTLVYSHGPPTAAPFTWPPENPATESMLSMTPEVDGERNMLRFRGPWGLFRLFDAGRILVPDASDIVPYQFNIGSRSLRLLVTAPPTRNPFARDILSGFTCPELS